MEAGESKAKVSAIPEKIDEKLQNVKPILRSPEKKQAKPRAKIRFDEAVIAEHDKLRGTRQKIDEPDTPFNREELEIEASEDLSHSEKEEMIRGVPKNEFAAALSHKLEALTENPKLSEPAAAIASREKEFIQQRNQHYNEFKMMKRWKEQHGDEEEE
mmetsp:Transcript_12720/g.15385  ORF Transcript_12720/g.15385 Transcript_12720/m.15385 type:complete len:158 (-) Transcript_12720:1158-1631(-)|eukprot:CAMPEP_0184020678 /NCGR_PEP_ID=MMETSP0954-20121128/9489_1 /TAXON_ID=627963 /ORGANISM="Aplanochytrium sp, Strain PBS07" /LENGTH=157 /DNA_ID=CAMNT_0026302579 /DNA_START=210 /DNA_END=683 /DNA_ORIENTATION=-